MNQVSLIGQSLSAGMNFLRLSKVGICSLSPCSTLEPAGAGIFSAEPVIRRTPAIRAFYADAVPHFFTVRTARKRRNSIHDCVLPVQFGKNLVIFHADVFRWQAITPVCPGEHGGVRAEHEDLRAETLRRDAMVFLAPLTPLFPLITTHPAEHERNAFLVGKLDNMLAGDFRFPAEKIDAEVLRVAQDVRFALRIVAKEKVGRVVAAANQKIAPVHLQVEITAPADVGETFVVVAKLRDFADAKAKVRTV